MKSIKKVKLPKSFINLGPDRYIINAIAQEPFFLEH